MFLNISLFAMLFNYVWNKSQKIFTLVTYDLIISLEKKCSLNDAVVNFNFKKILKRFSYKTFQKNRKKKNTF